MKKHLAVAIFITFAFIFLSNIPFMVGFMTEPAGLKFLGRHYTNSQDVYTDIAFIEQAKQGQILFKNLYSNEDLPGTFFRPYFLVIGKFADIFNTSSLFAYHLFRIIGSVIFCFSLYIFLGKFFKDNSQRLISFAIVLFSSGVGFLVSKVIPESTDLWIPESVTFLAFLEGPHFIISQALMIIGFLFFLKGLNSGKILNFFVSSISFFFLAFIHPFNLLVTLPVVVLTVGYATYKKEVSLNKIRVGILILIISQIAGILYQVVVSNTDPTLKVWVTQNYLYSPSLYNYLFGYGFILILALFGMEKYLKEKKLEQIFILIWVAVGFIGLYFPVFFQRRLSEGLHIPLSILATVGLFMVIKLFINYVSVKAQKIAYWTTCLLAVAILSIGSLSTIINDILIIKSDFINSYYYHILTQEKKAMNWIKSNTSDNDVILANWFYGNLIPGFTGRRVYLGHKVQTPEFEERVNRVNKFLLEEDAKKAVKFLKDNRITYIFLGNNDSILQYGFEPSKKAYLVKVFDEGGVTIWKVRE